MRTPHLMVRDPDLINRVLIKDFAHFTDHGLYVSGPDRNPLGNGLFSMKGVQWKVMRQKLTPAFTSGKLKSVPDQIAECSAALVRSVADGLAQDGGDVIEVRDRLGSYSTDVIGTCAFGLRLDSVRGDGRDSEFRKHGRAVFEPTPLFLLREMSSMISPGLRKASRIPDMPSKSIEFFEGAFTETMRHRAQNGIVRQDVMQAIIQARTDLIVNKTEPDVKFEESDIVANAFVMFVAGFETVSTTMSFCLYELALKKHIQDRVRAEMIETKAKYGGEMKSDFISDLHYVERVLAETLRKYPPLITLFRECTKDYHVPDADLVIKKGTKIIIPSHAIHYDHKYYPDPETFDPDRFTPEEKAKRPSCTYLPFGEGPRICIGKRFAEIEMKLALSQLLTRYEVEPCDKTDIPLKFTSKSIVLAPENGIWLKFIPIKQ